jgi:putative ABC transport system ATP-binding protein
MLKLERVVKTYRSGSVESIALNKISIEIAKNEMVALSGPSGSGKSTLLNICGLLDLNFDGQLTFDGQLISKRPRDAMLLRRRHLGFVFQRFNLVPVMSAFENIEYPLLLNKVAPRERQLRVDAMLQQVGLEAFGKKRPGQLSGGQQQRVAVARALINQPDLVIADEPTASLDSKTAYQIIDLMKELGQQFQTTFLIASHDDRMTSHCDRIIRILDGELVDAAGGVHV